MILEKLEDKQLIENDNENETVRGQILPQSYKRKKEDLKGSHRISEVSVFTNSA